MTEWKTIDSAPKNKALLLYGMPDGPAGVRYGGPLVLTGYWDQIDGAWCSTTSAWDGPFINASHWMPLPEPPSSQGRET